MSNETLAIQTMADVLNQNIRDVLVSYPSVGTVLGEFDVGCVSCQVGTCALKDVVNIHNLSAEQEAALFGRIAQIIFPGRTMEIPALARKAPARPALRTFSPPMQELVNEHQYIKRVLALIPRIAGGLETGMDEKDKATLRRVIDFVRHYADRYHHAKEEDILFKYFDASSEMLKAMHAEHETGRGHIRVAAEAVEAGDRVQVRDHLAAYGALLSEHIRKEDEILYPWMDREMTDAQIGQLFQKFRAVDEQFGGQPEYYRNLVVQLEQRVQGVDNK